MTNKINKFSNKSNDNGLIEHDNNNKPVPTEYAQVFGDAMNLLNTDLRYISDDVNAKYLDNFDLANIFYKLANRMQPLQSDRLNIYPCTFLHCGAPKYDGKSPYWNVGIDNGYKPLNNITNTVGPLSTKHHNNITCTQLRKRLNDLVGYMESCQPRVKNFAKHEDILAKHNYKNDKDLNQAVGVQIDNVVNNHENG